MIAPLIGTGSTTFAHDVRPSPQRRTNPRGVFLQHPETWTWS
jgi:hypothetical protein